jgi:hypothetical protein
VFALAARTDLEGAGCKPTERSLRSAVSGVVLSRQTSGESSILQEHRLAIEGMA